ncbi:hypothetical protein FOA52_014528 [Chlamydomonas sp. UWO 241]|nr:hypothetical protein FOA52_014528 [Chlamydomonas sp. UWO 241]
MGRRRARRRYWQAIVAQRHAQRRVAHPVDRVHDRVVVGEQQRDALDPSPARGLVQRHAPPPAARVGVRAVREQQHQDLVVAAASDCV